MNCTAERRQYTSLVKQEITRHNCTYLVTVLAVFTHFIKKDCVVRSDSPYQLNLQSSTLHGGAAEGGRE